MMSGYGRTRVDLEKRIPYSNVMMYTSLRSRRAPRIQRSGTIIYRNRSVKYTHTRIRIVQTSIYYCYRTCICIYLYTDSIFSIAIMSIVLVHQIVWEPTRELNSSLTHSFQRIEYISAISSTALDAPALPPHRSETLGFWCQIDIY